MARILAPELYRLAGERERPVLAWGFAACVAGSGLLVLLAPSAWMAVGYLSLVYMAVSVMNACFLSFFPLRFAREGTVATTSGIMDFATYLGTGLSSMVFGVMIERYGYSAMFISWAVLCGIGLLLQRKE